MRVENNKDFEEKNLLLYHTAATLSFKGGRKVNLINRYKYFLKNLDKHKYICYNYLRPARVGQNAAMAQLVEHILGKDEVPGSNPGSSSKQPRGFRLGALVL